MKLTKSMRDEFVDNVMAGIPVQHKFNNGEARLEIARAIEKQLPADVQEFAAKYPDLIKRCEYITLTGLEYDQFDGKRTRMIRPLANVIDHPDAKPIDLTQWIERKRMCDEEQDRRKELRSRITQIAASCGTLAKLRDALPELESYMPAEQIAAKNLPIAAGGVVTDLLNAGLKVPKAA